MRIRVKRKGRHDNCREGKGKEKEMEKGRREGVYACVFVCVYALYLHKFYYSYQFYIGWFVCLYNLHIVKGLVADISTFLCYLRFFQANIALFWENGS